MKTKNKLIQTKIRNFLLSLINEFGKEEILRDSLNHNFPRILSAWEKEYEYYHRILTGSQLNFVSIGKKENYWTVYFSYPSGLHSLSGKEFASLIEAKNYVDQKLIEQGCILIDKI